MDEHVQQFFNDRARIESPHSGLSEEDIRLFKSQGWVGPFTFLSLFGVNELTDIYLANQSMFISGKEILLKTPACLFSEKPWFKSVHAFIPAFYDIMTHPYLTDKISSLLGPDVLLWGTSVTTRQPGQKHRWHVDVEHTKWNGVSVFIGLRGVCDNASLKVISGSQSFTSMPQNLGLADDNEVLTESRKTNLKSEIVNFDIREGEIYFFDGPLWHGSENNSANTRYAIIAQFTTPENKTTIPLGWDEPIRWSSFPPPCILVAGKDDYGYNNLVTRPEI